ncbi:MAG: cytochrome c oxidase subunit 3 [Saprospiraceae bacterium]|nr:cytochrome c oxidase subunit 3 [Saprospiraceae bacterium]
MSYNKYNYNDEKEPPLLKVDPYKLGMFLLLAGLAILFISFTFAYIYTRVQMGNSGVYMPPIFWLNSILLVASSYTVNEANKAYAADDTAKYQRTLWYTLGLTVLFLIAQIIAWTVYQDALLGENIGIGKQYLYMISAMHFAHVVGGMPFLMAFIYTARKRMVEPVSVLIYFSDPTKRKKLQLLTLYWHFLDGLWIFLVAFFALGMLL